ncbi:MAG: sugar transferase [Gemmataceae bacterium]
MSIVTSTYHRHYTRMTFPTPSSVSHYEVLKRMMDVTGASFLLLVLSPLMALTALLIRLTDGGPALFCQTRVGKGGRRFKCFKFRSMIINAQALQNQLAGKSQHSDSRTFKIRKDPRITWVGRLIRKASIDELPQLWNVLIGDMSLVGPRPPLPAEVTQYSASDLRRLAVKPGLTCTWQVSGRANLPFEVQVQLDVEYIENRSLWLDVKLLVMTIPAVLFARGAY